MGKRLNGDWVVSNIMWSCECAGKSIAAVLLLVSETAIGGATSQALTTGRINVDETGQLVITQKPGGGVKCFSQSSGWEMYDNTICPGGGAASGYEFVAISNIPEQWQLHDITGASVSSDFSKQGYTVLYTNGGVRSVGVYSVGGNAYEGTLQILNNYIGQVTTSEPDGYYEKNLNLSFGLSDKYRSGNIVGGVGGNVILTYYVKNGGVTPEPPKVTCRLASSPAQVTIGSVAPGAGNMTKTTSGTVICENGDADATITWTPTPDCHNTTPGTGIYCDLPNGVSYTVAPYVNLQLVTGGVTKMYSGSNAISFNADINIPTLATAGYFSKSMVLNIAYK